MAYLAVQQCHVFDIGVLNNIFHAWILPNASHADTVGIVTPQILHKHVRGIGFRSKAVISNLNAGIGDSEAVDIQRVKSVRVLGFSLILSAPAQLLFLLDLGAHRCICRKGVNENIVKRYILRLYEKVSPARGIQLCDSLN